MKPIGDSYRSWNATQEALRAHVAAPRGSSRSLRLTDRITLEAGMRSGKPCIRGTRITTSDTLEYLAGGMAETEILQEFPEIEPEDIRAVLQYAALRERRIAGILPHLPGKP